MHRIFFGIYFVLYTVILIVKYTVLDKTQGLLEVAGDYFFINIAFLIMIVIATFLHRALSNSALSVIFLNNKMLNRIMQYVLLAISIVLLFFIPTLETPVDMMTSFAAWFYLYYTFVCTMDDQKTE